MYFGNKVYTDMSYIIYFDIHIEIKTNEWQGCENNHENSQSHYLLMYS
jgi:hypothetical protein